MVLARWAWLYRSELAPLTTAALVWLAAWLLHVFRPHWWPWLATLAAAGACLITAGRHLGLPTRAERLFAAVTTAAAEDCMQTDRAP